MWFCVIWLCVFLSGCFKNFDNNYTVFDASCDEGKECLDGPTELFLPPSLFLSPSEDLGSLFHSITERSAFGLESKPDFIEMDGAKYPYEPLFISAVSTIQSRQPPYDKNLYTSDFQMIHLPQAGSSPSVCSSPFPAYYRPPTAASRDGAFTFVILPGAFATWKSGAFVNQTLHWIDKYYPGSRVITFDGFLSPHFLSTCLDVPWNFRAFSKDLYERLQDLFRSLQISTEQAGIFGYSQGGYIALRLLALDGKVPQEQSLFQAGGFLASPVMSHVKSYELIDHLGMSVPHDMGLFTLEYVLRILPLLVVNNFQIKPEHLLPLYKQDPQDFQNRIINEMSLVDLKNVMRLFDVPNVRHPRRPLYRDVFIDYALRNTVMAHASLQEKQEFFAKINGISDEDFQDIRQTTVLYFSLDDPFLSDAHQGYVEGILHKAKRNPNIFLFTPRWGSHVGVFMDPIRSSLWKWIFFESS